LECRQLAQELVRIAPHARREHLHGLDDPSGSMMNRPRGYPGGRVVDP
jgi:hypothetical protein